MPRKDAPEFYYSKSRDAYRKRLRNPVTGKWDIEVWGKTKAIAREKQTGVRLSLTRWAWTGSCTSGNTLPGGTS